MVICNVCELLRSQVSSKVNNVVEEVYRRSFM